MTLAEQLAEAIRGAQTKLTRMADNARQGLVKQRDDLQRLSRLTFDEQALGQQYVNATAAGETLRRDVERLRSEHDEMKAQLDRKLREVYDRLVAIYNSKATQIRASAVSSDVRQAMLAFSTELEKMSFPTEHAPFAQQLKQIPLLARVAADVRIKAVDEARSASQQLEMRAELGKKYQALSEEDRELKQEWDGLWKRLQQHYRPGEKGLLDDIETLDRRLASRLRQEILIPQLSDARIEREKGLSGIDPLLELQSLE